MDNHNTKRLICKLHLLLPLMYASPAFVNVRLTQWAQETMNIVDVFCACGWRGNV